MLEGSQHRASLFGRETANPPSEGCHVLEFVAAGDSETPRDVMEDDVRCLRVFHGSD
jgi:hypothetical protein